jgi:hypothetical protein
MMQTILHTCDRCGHQTEVAITVDRFMCRCGRIDAVDTNQPDYVARSQVCQPCGHRNPRGCGLLPRPCRVRMIWAGEQDPPELCPHADALAAIE